MGGASVIDFSGNLSGLKKNYFAPPPLPSIQ